MNYSTTATPVYPRWRGELQTGRHVWLTANGLSPLARGTPITQGRQCGPFRFIPAGAGNSRKTAKITQLPPVYPRWRGELSSNNISRSAASGLSPLARGTLVRLRDSATRGRFIPAGAGNSFPAATLAAQSSVYPRWRGELAEESRQHVVRNRFIPAGAGNSINRVSRCPSGSVYPRWRGELVEDSHEIWAEAGLSPLARGTL